MIHIFLQVLLVLAVITNYGKLSGLKKKNTQKFIFKFPEAGN